MADPHKPYCTLLDKWKLVEAIHSDPELTSTDKVVAFHIIAFFNRYTANCYPSYETLAGRAKVSRRAVIKSVNRLVDDKWFSRRKWTGRGRSNWYFPAFERGKKR